jgi:membrane-associated protease RseP (regulator of RpoE activity)
MEDRMMNRSWTIAAASAAAGAAALCLGLFLAVQKDSVADEGKNKVKVITVTADDAEAQAEMSLEDAREAEQDAMEEAHGAKGGYLGLSLREDTKSNEGGALVEHVVSNSPAAKAGLKDGDVIVGYGGEIVRGPAKVTEKLRAAKAGDKVTLEVRRDGKVQKIPVELGERSASVWSIRSGDFAPLDEEHQMELEKSLKTLDEKMPDLKMRMGKLKLYAPGRNGVMIFGRNKPLLGIEMVETTAELRTVMGGSKDAGVLVGKVIAGSAAERGGLKVGDLILSIDGDKVADSGDLAQAISSREGKTVDLDIVRDKRPMHLKAVLPKIDEPEDEPTGPRASVWQVAPAALPCPAALPVPPVPAVAPPAPAPLPAPPAPPALLRIPTLLV